MTLTETRIAAEFYTKDQLPEATGLSMPELHAICLYGFFCEEVCVSGLKLWRRSTVDRWVVEGKPMIDALWEE